PETFLGMPCVPDVAALALDPVDLLIVALPAGPAVAMVEALIAQGGGAAVVGLVAGGIGDGADHDGLAGRLTSALDAARRSGAWTPAVLGPNLLGHVVPALGLDTTFIPSERWRPEARPGTLTLLSQSGAFLLSRLAAAPGLGLGFGLALGNQLDVDLADVLEALGTPPAAPSPAGTPMHAVHASEETHASDARSGAELHAVAAYVEGFAPDALRRTALAARGLSAAGKRVLLYRAGRTDAGQRAAASHTGAMAGDLVLERAVLTRAGVSLAPTMRAFEAGLRWLSAYPDLEVGPVAILSNAGFETVCAADRLAPSLAAELDADTTARLESLLAAHGLGQLVTPRLPLDLTPMASLEAYQDVIRLIAEGDALHARSDLAPATRHTARPVILVGLVPFTRRLDLTSPERVATFVRALAAIGEGGPGPVAPRLALVLDGGPAWEALRRALAETGLPVFAAMEDAFAGLDLLALPSRPLGATLSG
ncbi:MAG: hypothetical protein JNJ59_24630, partial [Deltaproteobacteria bacterium]|nr:hypothetical protein [Deltaproteobacteria bacterium]